MIDVQTICHDITIVLVAKSSVSSPEEALKMYDTLLPEVQKAYEKAQQQKSGTTRTIVSERLW